MQSAPLLTRLPSAAKDRPASASAPDHTVWLGPWLLDRQQLWDDGLSDKATWAEREAAVDLALGELTDEILLA
jgi:hypothetical protein